MKAVFSSEAKLCATFIAQLPKGWRAFPETCEFDIVLVRDDGLQVGVEAKLTLNPKVILQASEEGARGWYAAGGAPDFRAVLVPYGTVGMLGPIAARLGLTVIQQMDKAVYDKFHYHYKNIPKPKGERVVGYKPELPLLEHDWRYWSDEREWYDFAPHQRLKLPEYVPDVSAGRSGPTKLTEWKIKAIKMAILVERRGFVTRLDFKHIGIDHRRWLDGYSLWLKRGETRGIYVAGTAIGTFRKQHPLNYAQIEADYEKWAPKEETVLTP